MFIFLTIFLGVGIGMLFLILSMIVIQWIVNFHRHKQHEYNFYRHDWFVKLGLYETADLVVEDEKELITWFVVDVRTYWTY